MAFLRRLIYVVLGSLAIAATFYALGRLLAVTGGLAVLGIDEPSVLRAGLVLAWAGALSCWAAGREIAFWSVNARPWQAQDAQRAGDVPAAAAALAARLGLPAAEVTVYPSREVNAFAVSRPFGANRIMLAVSTSLLGRLDQEETKAVIAHELAKVGSGDVATLLLVQGFVWMFTLFPARMVALLCGTSLRTAEEETASDLFEVAIIAALEICFVPLASLVARACARGAEARADRAAAAVVGAAPLRAVLADVAAQNAATPLREVFTAPLKFVQPVKPALRFLSYHLPVATRLAAL